MRAFEYRHVVTFEETNVIGNVYYVHHIRWQGKCRELFLREHAPEILDDIARGLVLNTVSCSCRYEAELRPFDTVVVRMRLGRVVWNRLVLEFEYVRETDGRTERVATGEQEIACRRRSATAERDGPAGADETVDTEIPRALLDALEPYRREV